jgi:hypothetical protein
MTNNDMILTKQILAVLLIAIIATLPVRSKEEDRKSDDETKIMMVALGSVPPRRYSDTQTQGDSAMLLPAEGEVPPSRLYYKAGHDHQTAPNTWMPFDIAFNNTTVMKPVKAGEDLQLYRESSKGYERYVTVAGAEAGARRVVFLTPSVSEAGSDKPWLNRPKVTVITPDAPGLRGKQFLLKNLSRKTVLHAFGETITNIDPGLLVAYPRTRSGVLYRLAARYGKQRKIIYNMAIKLDIESGTHLYALYDTKPETNAGRSVGVFRTILPPHKP